LAEWRRADDQLLAFDRNRSVLPLAAGQSVRSDCDDEFALPVRPALVV